MSKRPGRRAEARRRPPSDRLDRLSTRPIIVQTLFLFQSDRLYFDVESMDHIYGCRCLCWRTGPADSHNQAGDKMRAESGKARSSTRLSAATLQREVRKVETDNADPVTPPRGSPRPHRELIGLERSSRARSVSRHRLFHPWLLVSARTRSTLRSPAGGVRPLGREWQFRHPGEWDRDVQTWTSR